MIISEICFNHLDQNIGFKHGIYFGYCNKRLFFEKGNYRKSRGLIGGELWTTSYYHLQ